MFTVDLSTRGVHEVGGQIRLFESNQAAFARHQDATVVRNAFRLHLGDARASPSLGVPVGFLLLFDRQPYGWRPWAIGSSFLCGWPIKRQEKNNSLLGHFWKGRGAAEGCALREPVRGTCQV
jgi:hypothetical protein